MDRTQEFMQAARLAAMLPGVGGARAVVAAHVSPFSADVTLIDRGLHVVSLRLTALRELSAACSSPFRTPSDAHALQHAACAIRNDLARLSGLVAGILLPGVSDAVARHSRSVADILRSRVSVMHRDLETVLSAHSSRTQQTTRREQAFSYAPERVQQLSEQQLSEQQLSEQQLSEQPPPDRTHAETALQNVHRTLLETGALVQHLSLLVAEQGELALRIDDNVAEASDHVEQATQCVTSYFHRTVTAATGGRLLLQALGVVGLTLLVVLTLA